MVTREELRHWWHVGSRFAPWRAEFWLGLMHDTVEDGYLPRTLLRWPALDAITRRDGEDYRVYIERVALNRRATRVKLADLAHNLSRHGGPPRQALRDRYLWAQRRLGDTAHPRDAA